MSLHTDTVCLGLSPPLLRATAHLPYGCVLGRLSAYIWYPPCPYPRPIFRRFTAHFIYHLFISNSSFYFRCLISFLALLHTLASTQQPQSLLPAPRFPLRQLSDFTDFQSNSHLTLFPSTPGFSPLFPLRATPQRHFLARLPLITTRI